MPTTHNRMEKRTGRFIPFPGGQGGKGLLHVLSEFTITMAIQAVSALIGLLFYGFGFSDANIITIFILGVLITSVVTTRRSYGALAALCSVLLFNFLFTEPRFTLRAYNPEYPVTFFIMFAASLLTSTLTMKVKAQAKEKNEANEKRNRVEMEARQEQLRANLLRAISHDLRTPLTSISGNASLLLDNTTRLSEEQKRALTADIRDDAEWLNQLVENLLSVTRIENGTLSLQWEPELVEDVIREALRHVSRLPLAGRVHLDMEDDMIMARMDSRLIIQVLINLLDNAGKHVPDDSPILVTAEREDGWVVIRVADQGNGVPTDSKERIFDMFVSLGKEHGDRRRGLGLGLYLCRVIIQAHRGRIWVEDNKTGGSTFCFTLPAEEVTT